MTNPRPKTDMPELSNLKPTIISETLLTLNPKPLLEIAETFCTTLLRKTGAQVPQKPEAQTKINPKLKRPTTSNPKPYLNSEEPTFLGFLIMISLYKFLKR